MVDNLTGLVVGAPYLGKLKTWSSVIGEAKLLTYCFSLRHIGVLADCSAKQSAMQAKGGGHY